MNFIFNLKVIKNIKINIKGNYVIKIAFKIFFKSRISIYSERKLNYLINSVNITTNINEVDYFGFE